MYGFFWKTILFPLLAALRPQNIVEIGSDKGTTTRLLLNFAQQQQTQVHVIDPNPKYDPTEWCQKWGDTLRYYKESSLTALSKIPAMDAVLIDGDHNYYTVLNELHLINQSARKRQWNFPLVFLHDVTWPYGRRDLYYQPEAIPDSQRQPWQRKGLIFGQSPLADSGGFNSHLCHAMSEGGPRNGVLTAIEDFNTEHATTEPMHFVMLPVQFGLAILAPHSLLDDTPDLAHRLAALTPTPELADLLTTMESRRLEGLMK